METPHSYLYQIFYANAMHPDAGTRLNFHSESATARKPLEVKRLKCLASEVWTLLHLTASRLQNSYLYLGIPAHPCARAHKIRADPGFQLLDPEEVGSMAAGCVELQATSDTGV